MKARRRTMRLMQAAEALQVSPSHLYRVITGERQGITLLRRYNAWRQKHDQPIQEEAHA